jgi:heptosyltransferase-2
MGVSPSPDPRRIVLRAVNWLGDAIMSTPAVMRIRERFPEARITLVTPSKLAGLWEGHPGIDEVIALAPKEGVWSVGRRLRPLKFDLGFAFPNSPRSAMELFLGGVRRRVGGRWPWRNWMLTDVVEAQPGAVEMRRRTPVEIRRALADPDATPHWGEPLPGPEAHHIHQYLRLLGPVGGSMEPMVPVIRVDPAVAAATRATFGLGPDRRWIGINAGAEYGPAKRWPAGAFRWMIGELVLDPELGVVIFGGPADVELARSLVPAGSSAVRVLAGKTTLTQLAAALQSCAVVVTNDTGPMHLAAAVGTPVLVPFGSTSPELTGPGLPGDPRHRFVRVGVPCGPCFLRTCPVDHRCLEGIAPEWVLSELRAMLG